MTSVTPPPPPPPRTPTSHPQTLFNHVLYIIFVQFDFCLLLQNNFMSVHRTKTVIAMSLLLLMMNSYITRKSKNRLQCRHVRHHNLIILWDFSTHIRKFHEKNQIRYVHNACELTSPTFCFHSRKPSPFLSYSG